MIQLNTLTVRVLEASYYARDCGTDHVACDVCGDFIHAGQLIYTNGEDYFHTRCALPTVRVHELHALISGGAR